MKRVLSEHSDRFEGAENEMRRLNERMAAVEAERDEYKGNNRQLQEDILKLQAQSMKENIIISGVAENDDRFEDTEAVVRKVFSDNLKLTDANEIGLQAVHRLKRKPNGGPRSIVVRFEKRKDKTLVLSAGPKLQGTNMHVFEQFPAEISERRKKLLPKLYEMRDRGYYAELRYDKLFVNGRLYNPEEPFRDENLARRPIFNRGQGNLRVDREDRDRSDDTDNTQAIVDRVA